MARKIDPIEYCTMLTNPPAASGDYQNSRRFYICKLTEHPCIARKIVDNTQDFDVFCYSRPEINKELLELCPAHNISKNLAKLLLKDVAKKRTEGIVKRVG